MSVRQRYRVVDLHAAGEPVRIVTDGAPALTGTSLLEKRRDAQRNFDHVRRQLMLEPRGHADMYGVWPTTPHHPDAALAVLFMHNSGYSTMCGHATIALGRWMLEQGLVAATPPETRLVLECPCGPVHVRVGVDAEGRPGRVAFDSVPAYAAQIDAQLNVPGLGRVRLDVGYGGAFYAVLPASRVGLSLHDSPLAALVDAGRRVTMAGRAGLNVAHPDEPDLGFLYGTILTEDAALGEADKSTNLCVFGGGQIDRSATGSGITARLALAHDRGEVPPNQAITFYGPSGIGFTGEIVAAVDGGIIARIAGEAHYTSESVFIVEESDPLGDGFTVPKSLADLEA